MLPTLRAPAITQTRMPSETAVSSQVDPFPIENAAPGLRIRLSLISDPTRSTGSPGVSESSAQTLLAWSSTSTSAASPSSTAYSRRRPPVGTGAGGDGVGSAAVSGAPASSCMACIGSHEEPPGA